MYLMTAHNTIVGKDDDGKCVQLSASYNNIPRFVRFDNLFAGGIIEHGPFLKFKVELANDRVAFTKDGKYLCAPMNSTELVADRENRNAWELFTTIPEEDISNVIDQQCERIIYDIGSNNGDDIPYYLLKGDKVIAIEANPALARYIKSRFRDEIAAGRLIVENCVVTVERSGEVNFYLHKTHDILSQLPEPNPTDRQNFDKVLLPSKNVLEIIKSHGYPYYIKIDIEHYDHVLLKYLFLNEIRPPYLSCESHTIDVFCILVALGNYRAFKLVDGEAVCRDYETLNLTVNDKIIRYSFPHHSAGPMGNDIAGQWMDKAAFFDALSRAKLGWKDIHVSSIDSPENPG